MVVLVVSLTIPYRSHTLPFLEPCWSSCSVGRRGRFHDFTLQITYYTYLTPCSVPLTTWLIAPDPGAKAGLLREQLRASCRHAGVIGGRTTWILVGMRLCGRVWVWELWCECG